jgi:hypothetical protein
MKTKLMIKSIFIATILLVLSFLTVVSYRSAQIIERTSNDTSMSDDWYYLPAFPNYAPNGLPDFDQRQEESWHGRLTWAFCVPVALADVLWWFDSKHSDPNGSPGDGVDDYPLVKEYEIPSNPEPGPNKDDHDYNNVNDPSTSWDGSDDSGELIEQIANYVDIFWYKIPFLYVEGTDRFSLVNGAREWIKDAGLEDEYKVENIYKPSFELIKDRVMKNQGVILRLGCYFPNVNILVPLVFGHTVAVEGVNPDGYLAVSNPLADVENPCENRTLHNNPAIVSHDICKIDYNTPFPTISNFWIPELTHHRSVIVIAAIIISEIN